MACVETQSQIPGGLCGGNVAGEYLFEVLICLKRTGVRLGVKLDAVGADLGGCFDSGHIRVHKKTYSDAGIFQLFYDRYESVFVFGEVPAVVGGVGGGVIGYERGLVGFDLGNELHIFSGEGIALDIELDGEHFGEFIDVCISYVSLVRAGMDCYSVCAGIDYDFG